MGIAQIEPKIVEIIRDFFGESMNWSPSHISTEICNTSLHVRIKGYLNASDMCLAKDELFNGLLKETKLESFLNINDKLKATINHVTGLNNVNIYPDIGTGTGDLILFISFNEAIRNF